MTDKCMDTNLKGSFMTSFSNNNVSMPNSPDDDNMNLITIT